MMPINGIEFPGKVGYNLMIVDGRIYQGSGRGTGGPPGLQIQWQALRGVCGGFDSHPLPPGD